MLWERRVQIYPSDDSPLGQEPTLPHGLSPQFSQSSLDQGAVFRQDRKKDGSPNLSTFTAGLRWEMKTNPVASAPCGREEQQN